MGVKPKPYDAEDNAAKSYEVAIAALRERSAEAKAQVAAGGRSFLDGKVTLYAGDCTDILQALPENSIDSVVCDPPYHLTSIVKRFGADGAAPAKVGKTGAYARASAGFMGKQWDGGDIAFRPETWAEVFRVLKPGGHLVAFSGTRTYHRMVCAIEDAGFEVRDQIGWAYGSGFPKSHDVSKGIDRAGGIGPVGEDFKDALVEAIKASGKTRKQIDGECGFTMRYDTPYRKDPIGWGCTFPSEKQWTTIKKVLDLDDGWDAFVLGVARDIVATQVRKNAPNGVVSAGRPSVEILREITEAKTEAAKQWEGWGTALKPAWEPIVLARKPLIGTVSENVLQHGTGAINVDGCRVGFVDGADLAAAAAAAAAARRALGDQNAGRGVYSDFNNGAASLGPYLEQMHKGRWPANLIHDGSEEVLAAFPDAGGQQADIRLTAPSEKTSNVYGKMSREGEASANRRYTDNGSTNFAALPGARRDDSGSAARFFYTAKADSEDRLGSKHPTVKPLDLMQWLVRLVTPKGGVVLDPFAGTGTAGEAAWREGMRAILIEREEEYQADIARRMELATNPTKRAAVAATKNKLDDPNELPLFAKAAP